jgi:DNA-binding NarL/FixJ family response regulator
MDIMQSSKTQPPIRILLVDDHQIVLLGLQKLIDDNKPNMEIVGSATNIADAKRLVAEKQPDILLLNIYLGDTECINFIPEFVENKRKRLAEPSIRFELFWLSSYIFPRR